MKTLILILIVLLVAADGFSQSNSNTLKTNKMKLNAGIITEKLQETKDFYVNKLGFGVTFENEWYILLHTPGKGEEIAFLKPGLPAQAPIFRKAFTGGGIFLTIEMEDVDEWYKNVKEKGVKIEVEIKDEDWGDRHFAVVDPNGIGIDFVHYQEPKK